MPDLPRFIRPCRPVMAKSVPEGDAWLHEPKLNGSRLEIVKDRLSVHLHTLDGRDCSNRLAHVAEILELIRCRTAIIDALLYFPGNEPAPDLPGLRGAIRDGWRLRLLVLAFDLLYRNGADLRRLPLIDRRTRLLGTVSQSQVPILHVVPCFSDTRRLAEAVACHAIRGIISKRRAAPYHSGFSLDWVETAGEAVNECSTA